VGSWHDIFSFVCGQQHNWVVGGEELPFCQRCTGLYVGALPALLVYLRIRPKATNGLLWLHGMCLLVMAPFGYHLVAQNGAARMLTGQLFAIGLIYYLTLLAADRWTVTRALSSREIARYLAAEVATLLLLQAAVIWGGPRTNVVLAWMGLGGLVVYGLLVLLNLLLLALAAGESLRRRAPYSET
jgi:uncharacterized membrane protein